MRSACRSDPLFFDLLKGFAAPLQGGDFSCVRLPVSDCDVDTPVKRITAHDAMVPQEPLVTCLTDTRPRQGLWALIFRPRGFARGLIDITQQDVDLTHLKAGQLDVKVEIDQTLKLNGQNLAIPPRLLGKLVIGNDIGPSLGRG